MRFTQTALEYAYNRGGYIVHGWSVYQVFYSKNAGYYVEKIYTKPRPSVPLANRGYWHAFGAEFINKLVGFELLNI